MWNKICKNLKTWGDNEMVITQTMKLLKDISSGYESSKMLLDLDSVNYVLQHHTVISLLVIHIICRLKSLLS